MSTDPLLKPEFLIVKMKQLMLSDGAPQSIATANLLCFLVFIIQNFGIIITVVWSYNLTLSPHLPCHCCHGHVKGIKITCGEWPRVVRELMTWLAQKPVF